MLVNIPMIIPRIKRSYMPHPLCDAPFLFREYWVFCIYYPANITKTPLMKLPLTYCYHNRFLSFHPCLTSFPKEPVRFSQCMQNYCAIHVLTRTPDNTNVIHFFLTLSLLLLVSKHWKTHRQCLLDTVRLRNHIYSWAYVHILRTKIENISHICGEIIITEIMSAFNDG